jgi:hypothetical protein
MIHVSSSAQIQLQGWLLLRLYSFLKKIQKNICFPTSRQADSGIPIA